MRIKILCWNVRGLNDIEKRKLIKGVVRNQKSDLVCLMETQVKDMSLQMVNSVGVGRFLNWALVDARGAAEGLLLFWDNSLGEVRGGKRGVLHLCSFQKLR